MIITTSLSREFVESMLGLGVVTASCLLIWNFFQFVIDNWPVEGPRF